LVYFHPIRWLQRFRELRKTAAASHNEVKTLFLLPNYLNLFAVIVSALPFELMDRHAVCRGVFTTIYIFSQTKSGLSKRISNSLDFMNEFKLYFPILFGKRLLVFLVLSFFYLAREPKVYNKFFTVHFCWWSQVECHAADAT